MLTEALLKEYLWYDPVLGKFIWIKSPAKRINIGDLAGRIDSMGYWMLGFQGRQYRQHRLAFLYMTGRWPDQVDHLNGDRSDNRWDNLREATHQQNNWNRDSYKNSKTGVKGVFPSKKKYQVQIRYKGKANYCGTYETLALAQEVSELMQEMIQGDFKHGPLSSS